MKIPMTPGTVRLAEELTIQRGAEHVTNAISSLRLAADYAGMLAEAPGHADEAKLRIDAYLAASDAFEKVWTSALAILQRVGNLEDEIAKRVEEAEAGRPASPLEAMAAAQREAVSASVDQQVAAAAAAGVVSLCCPKCRTGRWVSPDGTCASCGEKAVDLVKIGNGEPGIPPGAEPEHGGTVVPIQKRDRRPR